MAIVNLKEINRYVANLLDQINIREVNAAHSEMVKNWFVSNMSNIGRYAHGNQEKFGTRNPTDPDDNIQGRQDGWQSVTEEVPHLDHITYGNGILYVSGEMEVPRHEDNSGTHIQNAQFCHVDKTGTVHHFEVDVDADVKGAFTENADGSDATVGYEWEFPTSTPTGDDNSGKWRYQSIIDGVVNIKFTSYNKDWAPGTESTHVPGIRTTFNDAEVYQLDNERNHFPYIIINSGQPASVSTLLQTLQGQNGMYDNALPDIAGLKGTYPPVNRIEITDAGAEAIIDFISPIDETPEYVYTETQVNDNYVPDTDAGKGGSAGSQTGKVSNVKASGAARPDIVGGAQSSANDALEEWREEEEKKKQEELEAAKAAKENEEKNNGSTSSSSSTNDEELLTDLTPEQIEQLQTEYKLAGVEVTRAALDRIVAMLEAGEMFLQPGHLTDPRYTLEGRRALGLPTPGADDDIERRRRLRERFEGIIGE
jgi:hypothetical protein